MISLAHIGSVCYITLNWGSLKKLDLRKYLTPLYNFIQHGLARCMMICCPDISPYNHSGFFSFPEILFKR